MGYYIDLAKITIDKYKSKLESAYLPPGRMWFNPLIHWTQFVKSN
jgi:hypothetical protein